MMKLNRRRIAPEIVRLAPERQTGGEIKDLAMWVKNAVDTDISLLES